MKRKPKAYRREMRKQQIKKLFNIWWHNGDHEPRTLNQIAKSLELEPTQHLRDILLEMEADGLIETKMQPQPGRWETRFYYPVVETLIMEKYLRRRITVSKRGVAVGQLELSL